jgi:hypothetical protein
MFEASATEQKRTYQPASKTIHLPSSRQRSILPLQSYSLPLSQAWKLFHFYAGTAWVSSTNALKSLLSFRTSIRAQHFPLPFCYQTKVARSYRFATQVLCVLCKSSREKRHDTIARSFVPHFNYPRCRGQVKQWQIWTTAGGTKLLGLY